MLLIVSKRSLKKFITRNGLDGPLWVKILVPGELWDVQRRAMIVGLGAGLLPMFVHNHIPVDTIQVLKYRFVVTVDNKVLHFVMKLL